LFQKARLAHFRCFHHSGARTVWPFFTFAMRFFLWAGAPTRAWSFWSFCRGRGGLPHRHQRQNKIVFRNVRKTAATQRSAACSLACSVVAPLRSASSNAFAEAIVFGGRVQSK